MSNAFAKHNIDHLSPSSLNLWTANPGLWALRYLAKIRDETSPAAVRGSAVENGFMAFLRNTDPANAEAIALNHFAMNMQGEIREDIDAERNLISPMLAVAIGNFQKPSDLNAAQIRVEHWFNDIPIPVIGYIDFCFDGIDIDLKTTKRLPLSAPSADHVRQVALYRAARGRAGGLFYVSDKKHIYHEVTDDMRDRALSDLECCARSLYWFLGRVDDARDAVRCLPMNQDDYRWKPKTTVALNEILMAG